MNPPSNFEPANHSTNAQLQLTGKQDLILMTGSRAAIKSSFTVQVILRRSFKRVDKHMRGKYFSQSVRVSE